ncbi:MAG: c-type cytochrome [Armatimonadetes bacterium]|nr:c-type cytochrome [Armatimonadota bacterium]
MLAKVSILIASLAVLGSATAFVQEDQPAEKVFKNISTFKGAPARDLMPAMRYMSSSLKVKCTFCHEEQNFAGDNKKEKQTAREMIEMTNGINKTYFEGKQRVTCNSCHNGHNEPSRLPAIEGLNPRHKRIETSVTPGNLIGRYASLVGGDFKSLQLTGTRTDEKGTATCEVVQAAPNKFRAKFGEIITGYNGTVAWASFSGHAFPMWGDNAVQVARAGRTFRTQESFARYEKLTISGRETVDGKSCLVARGSIPTDHVQEELYFEEKTGLLLRVATYTESPLGPIPTFVDYDDYRKVGAVLIPFKITATNEEGEVTTYKFTSATPDVDVDDSMFAQPGN